jgi:hypothetical protein
MEWLFLTCHNYWIVCRLVRDDDHPFLAYSPKISIKDSSEPFRAFLGAIISVLKGAHIEPSTFNPDIQLDTIIEDTNEGPLQEDEIEGIRVVRVKAAQPNLRRAAPIPALVMITLSLD